MIAGHTVAEGKERRSQRIVLDVPVIVRSEPSEVRSFQERTFTLTVSAHGALVLLASPVEAGQRVVVMDPKSWDEREGQVIYVGRRHAGLAQVGIEFTQPAPEFWRAGSLPADWNRS